MFFKEDSKETKSHLHNNSGDYPRDHLALWTEVREPARAVSWEGRSCAGDGCLLSFDSNTLRTRQLEDPRHPHVQWGLKPDTMYFL